MKALFFVKPQSREAAAAAAELEAELARHNVKTILFSWNNNEAEQTLNFSDCDVVVSLGGDGTVLYAARTASPHNIPIIPVNIGTLGFIASVNREDAAGVFSAWLAGESAGNYAAMESQRLMLEVRIERGGKIIFTGSCLNDAVVSADGIAKTIRLDASIVQHNNEKLELASYRSDGLILATPTGSTAYSASAGGPILDPETEDLIVTPVCPFTLLHRPLVIPTGSTLNVSIPHEQRTGIILTVDGQITRLLEPDDNILIRKAAFKARLVASDRKAFYRALHTKLAWPCPQVL
ncbi:MAG: NAD(+)/NADH kinase [Spirochaetaceae bacterium]|jgi:NAD+ kinase|nr:NAD(+)/NADH kinase [Spirochaetaceae bacterium]